MRISQRQTLKVQSIDEEVVQFTIQRFGKMQHLLSFALGGLLTYKNIKEPQQLF